MELFVNTLLPTLLPVLIGMIIQPIMGAIKRVSVTIDRQAAPIQQVIIALMAWGMTEASTLLNVMLPSDLSLVTNAEVTAAISAGIAMAIHAGKKAKIQ